MHSTCILCQSFAKHLDFHLRILMNSLENQQHSISNRKDIKKKLFCSFYIKNTVTEYKKIEWTRKNDFKNIQ